MVTTTVPCSTNTASIETVTAKMLQILIVPSPIPYVDPECGCSKTNIVYVDAQSITQTIPVQPAGPVLPTQQPEILATEAEPSACDCTECYYTVKKTMTVTATCTAAPVSTSLTLLPTFVGGGAESSVPIRVTFVLGLAVAFVLWF
jgi:hypothetical protein